MPLVLASASPRRAELLKAAGFEIDIVPVDVDERVQANESPRDYVARLADAKAAAAAATRPASFIIGADTAVVVGGTLLGKPEDEDEAVEMLRMLSGKTHEVLTGVTVRVGERRAAHIETTKVHVAPLSGAEIAWYIATGEPQGKAGAYAIQGGAARFIDRIEGSYSNVVGLPVSVVYGLLKQLRYQD